MDALARMIDANANRAREGLRVMEDVARFGLGIEALCARCKAIRHGLSGVMQELGRAEGGPREPGGDAGVGAVGGVVDRLGMLASRDTPGDVGTRVEGAGERSRDGLAGMVAAGAGRAAEALRVIEESCKALGRPTISRRVEALRYELYECERRIGLALGASGNDGPEINGGHHVCVLITESIVRSGASGLDWLEVARACILAGADTIQLREKSLDAAELLNRARALVAMARKTPLGGTGDSGTGGAARRARVFVNDRPDVALLAGADGVHLGQRDLPMREARSLVGGRLRVGISTRTLEEARAAAEAGADVCGVGPMFASGTAPEKDVIAGPRALARYVTDAVCGRVPHLAIGGITPERVPELVAHGCRGVAISAAACAARDPGAVVARVREALGA